MSHSSRQRATPRRVHITYDELQQIAKELKEKKQARGAQQPKQVTASQTEAKNESQKPRGRGNAKAKNEASARGDEKDVKGSGAGSKPPRPNARNEQRDDSKGKDKAAAEQRPAHARDRARGPDDPRLWTAEGGASQPGGRPSNKPRRRNPSDLPAEYRRDLVVEQTTSKPAAAQAQGRPRHDDDFSADEASESGDESEGEAYSRGFRSRREAAKERARQAAAEGTDLAKELVPLLKRIRATDPQIMAQAMAKAKLVHAKYAESLLADISYAHKNDLDQTLWRTGFYIIIEEHRRLVRQVQDVVARKEEEAEQAKMYWRGGNSSVWDEARERQLQDTIQAAGAAIAQANADMGVYLAMGIRFYQEIVNKLQLEHGFRLAVRKDADMTWDSLPENLVVNVRFTDPKVSARDRRRAKLAQLSIHRGFVAMGDLERYRQSLLPAGDVRDWSIACNYYMCARWIAPRNAKPYNQLAVIASLRRMFFQAVYYHVRSLDVKVPFMTAKDALLQLFERVRAMVPEETPPVIEQLRADRQAALAASRQSGMSNVTIADESDTQTAAHEIWILDHILDARKEEAGDGAAPAGQNDNEPLSNQAPGVLVFLHDLGGADAAVEKMEAHFLMVFAALFTRVGMDQCSVYHNEAMEELEMLLNEQDGGMIEAIPPGRLVELVIVCLYIVGEKASEADRGGKSLPVPHTRALHTFFDLAASLATTSSYFIGRTDDLAVRALDTLLPALRIGLLYLTANRAHWAPLAVNAELVFSGVPVLNFLSALAQLATAAAQYLAGRPSSFADVQLWEDKFVYGAARLREAIPPLRLEAPDPPQVSEDVTNTVRLAHIVSAAQGIAAAIREAEEAGSAVTVRQSFVCDEQQGVFYSAAEVPQPPEALASNYEGEAEVMKASGKGARPPGQQPASDETDEALSALLQRKMELASELEQNRQHEEEVQAAVEQQRSSGGLRIEITPQYIVFDTNCYIRSLDYMKRIIGSKKFTVVIPLVVVAELKGLKRGQMRHRPVDAPEEDYDPRQREAVQRAAEATMEFLNAEFDRKNSHLKAMTTKGSLLNSIRFATEMTGESVFDTVTNDDLILNTTLCLVDTSNDERARLEGQPIKRRVVLVTDDINLRVKAHGRRVPVRGLEAFAKVIQMPVRG